MKSLLAGVLLVSSAGAGCAAHHAQAERLQVMRADSRPPTQGSAENFTGTAVIKPLFPSNEHRHASGAHVTFEPGARTVWHSHPAGQTLVVTSGTGWVQEWGGTKQELKPGDVVWTPPGIKHWHGATATEGMAHIALQEPVDGKVVDWMDKVSEAQYRN
ncbi:(R)-mandelonitrile lyase [Corallococcus llansteffanensis]|uniref:Cupin domain-containing protein n=1 Tax=Corallococcus llansteffanensis TaxID=2316731 RepID=A0A3A8P5H9_9BACT|nr:cupin domain-containing protein [Corallococcus llansteffanensis]RKH51648.1 cupin domain-containing protein [Corallococcus llansteffanensis]